ncbi:MAG: hypothetical protein IIB46_04795 [Nitrospinae bacterium]|nr:hypothetical protein [Nitrospinota bacterium]
MPSIEAIANSRQLAHRAETELGRLKQSARQVVGSVFYGTLLKSMRESSFNLDFMFSLSSEWNPTDLTKKLAFYIALIPIMQNTRPKDRPIFSRKTCHAEMVHRRSQRALQHLRLGRGILRHQ